jgi:hypothetical protein
MIGVGKDLAALGAECVRHRPALLGVLDDPPGAGLGDEDRAHLETCPRCRDEVTRSVLTGIAVRRSLAPARDACPPPDAWERLRTRIERQQAAPRRGRAASPVLGAALAASLAVATLIPLGLPGSSAGPMHEAGVNPAAIRAAGHRDAEAEVRQLRATMLAGKEASSDDDLSRARLELLRQEAAPAPTWLQPSRNPLAATAR